MAQLKNDEWPSDGEVTTHEEQVQRDPIAGPKDPHDERRPWPNEPDRDPGAGAGTHMEDARDEADRDTNAAQPKGRT